MDLVKCADCGQSINKKREVCPFCGAKVERLHRTSQGAHTPETTSSEGGLPIEDASRGTPSWHQRRNVVIVALLALLIVVPIAAWSILGGASLPGLQGTSEGHFTDRSEPFAVGVDDTVVVHVSAHPLKIGSTSAFSVSLEDADGHYSSELGEAANTATNYTSRDQNHHAGDYYLSVTGVNYGYSISVEIE